MSKIGTGKKAPSFKAAATGDQQIGLASLKGKNVVLYFYPKDNTPGCTTEGVEFAGLHAKFKRRNAVILGVSRDTVASHEKFKAKFDFPFELLADTDEKLCKAFDVIREKNMYGKKVLGVERSTFLIDAEGKLRREWRKVSAKGHAQEVLSALDELAK